MTDITVILGCTASGKGSLAREWARRHGAEIISADSMKVYRRMNIGTAKPSLETRRAIPHHLIDVVEPSDTFSVAEYVRMADAALADCHRRGKPAIVVGGTPLYLKALCHGLFEGPGADPEFRARLHEQASRTGIGDLFRRLQTVDPQAATRIHPNDLRRIVRALEVFDTTGLPISRLQTQWENKGLRIACRLVGLRRSREDQSQRSNERVRQMICNGLVEEVAALLAEPLPLSTAARQGLGYAEIIHHLQGKMALAETVELIKINTRRFAKAQRTWFRRFFGTEWFDLSPDSTAEQVADEWERRNMA